MIKIYPDYPQLAESTPHEVRFLASVVHEDQLAMSALWEKQPVYNYEVLYYALSNNSKSQLKWLKSKGYQVDIGFLLAETSREYPEDIKTYLKHFSGSVIDLEFYLTWLVKDKDFGERGEEGKALKAVRNKIKELRKC